MERVGGNKVLEEQNENLDDNTPMKSFTSILGNIHLHRLFFFNWMCLLLILQFLILFRMNADI